MQLNPSTLPTPLHRRSELGGMAGIELPSISMRIMLSPPPTPMFPLHAAQFGLPAQATGSPDHEGYICGPLYSYPQCGHQQTSGHSQRLPPISHILEGLPSSHHIRLPGFDAFANPTPPQSRHPSLADLKLPESRNERSKGPSSRRSGSARSQSSGIFEWVFLKHQTEDFLDQQVSTDGSGCYRSIVKATKSPICKAKKPKKAKKAQGSSTGKKRSNDEYDFIESLFVIYHRIDRGLTWPELEAAFQKWFPDHPARTRGGLQCQYYRLNDRIPVIDSEGLLDLGPFTKEELKDENSVSKRPYPLEGGVRYRIYDKKCRQDGVVPLAERFPEEVVYGGHAWILPEHRNDEKIKLAADKRARQRAEHLSWTLV
ncbi:hypothetical protein B0T16DRAFT_164937 [Cercophora newfieldiana]|uniref:Uncharacterized protein n=1 Tax=Cercophora newfieldiana TaxID=92897 RepID=A0AA40CQ55_9PEZI|nr:hypothetical protein B0T16DRAFT_164937 [Cercophora newfieldiana]